MKESKFVKGAPSTVPSYIKEYYYIDDRGNILKTINTNSLFDIARYSSGNMYLSIERAIKDLYGNLYGRRGVF